LSALVCFGEVEAEPVAFEHVPILRDLRGTITKIHKEVWNPCGLAVFSPFLRLPCLPVMRWESPSLGGAFLGRTVRQTRTARSVALHEYRVKASTWDQCVEAAPHSEFTFDTAAAVHFYDPCSEWQRKSSESTKGATWIAGEEWIPPRRALRNRPRQLRMHSQYSSEPNIRMDETIRSTCNCCFADQLNVQTLRFIVGPVEHERNQRGRWEP
jgi:hypothetical protein